MSDNDNVTNFKVIDKRSPETQARAAKMPVTKHTPGPWTPLFNGRKVIIDAPDARKFVCRTYMVFANAEESIANAHLIAAAPDLLEAGERALELIHGHNFEAGKNWDEIEDNLRDAIAKAKGE